MFANVSRKVLLGLVLLALAAAFASLFMGGPTLPGECRSGDAAMRTGDLDRAIDDYILCLGSSDLPDESMADVYYALANAYFAKGNLQQAASDYGEAIKLEPGHAWAYNNRCWVHGLLRQPEIALADCEEALRLLPDQPEILDSRAFARWQIGEPGKARADLERAHKIDSAFPTADERLREFQQLVEGG